ncbi:hypothetical protein AB0F59_12605 [Micromonospora lupini]
MAVAVGVESAAAGGSTEGRIAAVAADRLRLNGLDTALHLRRRRQPLQ